ncbi:MAG: hypothetical protein ACPLRM_00200 [Anaerolineae bacterium]
MSPAQYDKYVIRNPYSTLERDGKKVFEGFMCTPQQLQTSCQYLYSVVTTPHVNEATPHVHQFPVIMNFFGGDYRDIRDFDAEIWFYLGGERQIIDTPATVVIPAGLPHCPLIFKRVGKPIAWVEIMLTDHYEREELDIPLSPAPDFSVG